MFIEASMYISVIYLLRSSLSNLSSLYHLCSSSYSFITEEGPRALFKGVIPRVMIISPLFGITLATYEVLQGYFA